MQMVNQLTPVPNIGGIIAQAGTSQSASIPQGTAGSPDVTGNPRFDRYIWINTFAKPYVIYTYNATSGNWVINSTANFSLQALMFKRAQNDGVDISGGYDAITGGLDYKLLKNNNDGSATAGDARKILRLDSSGKFFVTSSAETILAGITGGIALSNLAPPGAVDRILRSNHTTQAVEWTAFDTANMIAAGAIIPGQLQPGTNLFVIRTNNSGVVEWVNTNAFLQSNDVTLDKLGNNTSAGGAPAQFNAPIYNGTSKVWAPVLCNKYAEVNAAEAFSVVTPKLYTASHGLGVIPNYVEAVVRCVTTDAATGWVANDEISIQDFFALSSLSSSPRAAVWRNSTTVGVNIRREDTATGDYQMLRKDATSFATPTAIGNFVVKFYVGGRGV